MDEDLKTHLREMEQRLAARIENSERNLLRAFHNWAQPMEIRQRGSSLAAAALDERLAFLEERIGELERARLSDRTGKRMGLTAQDTPGKTIPGIQN